MTDYKEKYLTYKAKYQKSKKSSDSKVSSISGENRTEVQIGGSDIVSDAKSLGSKGSKGSNKTDKSIKSESIRSLKSSIKKPHIPPSLDIRTSEFVQSLKNSTPINKMSITDARQTLNNIQSDISYKENVIISPPIEISGSSFTYSITINIFRPKKIELTQILPTIIYFHGGGWILGNAQTHGRLISEICTRTNTSIVFVNYTPSPERKYPTQLIESLDVLNWLGDNHTKYYLDVSKLIAMGDSVGANICTVMSFLSTEKGRKFRIGYQILLYPVTGADFNTESYNIFEQGPWLTKDSMKWFYNSYEPDMKTRSIPLISTLNVNESYLKNLAPTLIITDQNDVLRDEGEAFANKLMKSNPNVTAVRYLGTIHDFLMLDPLKNTPAVKSALLLISAHICDFLKN